MYVFRFSPVEGQSEHNINTLLKVASAPIIPFPEEIVETITYGDGTTDYIHTGKYKDRSITLECNYVERSKRGYSDKFSMIREYFGSGKGYLELTSDYPDHYFIAKSVSLSSKSRFFGVAGEFDITIQCDPYRYIRKYQSPIELTSDDSIVLSNPYELAYPVYRIYNQSPETELLTIQNNGSILSIENPFVPVTIGDEMDDWDIDYIEIDVQNEWLKRVGVDANFTTGYRVTYDTINTTGSFMDLALIKGQNELKFTIDKGSVPIKIYRNYREL